MSDADYTVNDYERTIEELRFKVKWLRTQVESLEKRLQWAREEADMCRIYMTKWQMAYEEEKAKHGE